MLPTLAIEYVARDNDKLTTLNLNRLQVESAVAPPKPSTTKVKKLAKALESNSHLTALSMGGHNLDMEDGNALAGALKQNKSLVELHLWRNQLGIRTALTVFTPRFSSCLQDALSSNQTVKILALDYNALDGEDGENIAKGLKVNRSLQQLYLRGNALGSKGAQAIALAMKQNPSVTTLDLSENGIDDSGGAVVGMSVKTSQTLKELDMSANPIGEKTAQSFAEALASNRCLEKLHFSHCQMTDEQAKKLIAALRTNRTITLLDLSNNGLNERIWEELFVLFKEGHATQLKGLNCRFNFGSKELQSLHSIERLFFSQVAHLQETLAKAPKLDTVALINTPVSAFYDGKWAAEVGRVVNASTTLRSLVLVSLDIADSVRKEIWKAFFDALCDNKSIEGVDLHDNKLGEAEGALIVQALRKNRTLRELILSGNNFGAASVAIAESLVGSSLRKVTFSYNTFPFAFYQALGKVLGGESSLESVDLSFCNVQEEGAKEIAEGLKQNRALKWLSLYSASLQEGGVTYVATALRTNRVLKSVNLGFNSCGPKAGVAIAHALKENPILEELDMVNNKMVDNLLDNSVGTSFVEALTVNDTLRVFRVMDSEESALSNDMRTKHLTFIHKKVRRNRIESEMKPPKVKVEADNKLETFETKESQVKDEQTEKRFEILEAGQKQMKIVVEEMSKQLKELIAAIESLRPRVERCETLIKKQEDEVQLKSSEEEYIRSIPNLRIYHKHFIRTFTGIWLGSQCVGVGMLKSAEKFTSDYIVQIINRAGSIFPFIGTATEVLKDIVTFWNDRDRVIIAQKIADLFTDPETAFREISILARQSTIAQARDLKVLLHRKEGFVARSKNHVLDAKACITGTDNNDPVSRRAEADCKKIFAVIQDEDVMKKINDGDVMKKLNSASLLKILMRHRYVYTSPISSPEPSSSPTPVPYVIDSSAMSPHDRAVRTRKMSNSRF